jgi:hypothetical protein
VRLKASVVLIFCVGSSIQGKIEMILDTKIKINIDETNAKCGKISLPIACLHKPIKVFTPDKIRWRSMLCRVFKLQRTGRHRRKSISKMIHV